MRELPDAVTRLLGSEAQESFLEPHHIEAARLLGRSFEQALLRQRVTMSYDPTRIGSKGSAQGRAELSGAVEDARRRLARLAQGIPSDCWGVLTDICVYDKGLQQIETERRWPRRSAKLVLRIGLEQLAQLMGLDAAATGRNRFRTQSWLPERPPMFPASEN
ncbi:DUF6456 domain-containing protein [Devosia marina]|uniref:DUF6456 domain-containing protein n=1 Tax=Devosia marina TaxID=2683198 RepID=A0A7X3K269_9HYPH|nr:DUF6456 domain-containing protein [Devosia marina]MVS97598.1 hypothetical protein [Devosia marina]